MRAVAFEQPGGYDRLQVIERPRPVPTDGQVLLRMQAAAVNPVDDVVRAGQFPLAKQPPLVLGNEGVGIVVEPGSSSFAPGTRVMVSGPYGVLQDGTWQEYILAQSQELAPVSDGLSNAEAAGVPNAYLTAQLALTVAGGFVPGKTVLPPGVGGAVGNAAVQLARAQGAARVITSAGSSQKAEQARAAGYADVVDLTKESLSAGVARLTGGWRGCGDRQHWRPHHRRSPGVAWPGRHAGDPRLPGRNPGVHQRHGPDLEGDPGGRVLPLRPATGHHG
jgi:NADPH:quinone reductase-like Zn-dependent oxidoreductase